MKTKKKKYYYIWDTIDVYKDVYNNTILSDEIDKIISRERLRHPDANIELATLHIYQNYEYCGIMFLYESDFGIHNSIDEVIVELDELEYEVNKYPDRIQNLDILEAFIGGGVPEIFS